MKHRFLAPILLGLLSLIAACSKSQPDARQASQPSNAAGDAKDSSQHSPATDRVASSAQDPVPTQVNCEAIEAEVRFLEERRRELQARLAADHPLANPVDLSRLRHLELKQVVETETKERALSQCLERERENGPTKSSTPGQ